ncbi:hypothetical protein PILCRDRAFT_8958 [Piloderma croceum F 1598]|uniref:HTH cro/C1-type domain-containing protein n=1 Tax=Piloderma croceum (strain F 1598) TaxID=765440 RepID=A0A0C3FQ40_PILCF|nr:hypothetical protein PILCRDRAFT_8958 [Piloderma croceum F 1598]
MAPNPSCSAVASAKEKSGLTYAQIASKIGQPEQHVIDVCTGKATPTASEYKALAGALGMTAQVPNDTTHPGAPAA